MENTTQTTVRQTKNTQKFRLSVKEYREENKINSFTRLQIFYWRNSLIRENLNLNFESIFFQLIKVNNEYNEQNIN